MVDNDLARGKFKVSKAKQVGKLKKANIENDHLAKMAKPWQEFYKQVEKKIKDSKR